MAMKSTIHRELVPAGAHFKVAEYSLEQQPEAHSKEEKQLFQSTNTNVQASCFKIPLENSPEQQLDEHSLERLQR